MIDRAQLESNLRAAYDRARALDAQHGIAWYGKGRAEVDRMARTYRYSRDTVAGIVAALSPRVQWAVNLRLAENLLAGRKIRGLSRSLAAADRILAGHPWPNVLRGPKTRAFAANLDGNDDVVTVDVWALRAAGWERPSVTPAQYRLVADAYATVAREVGMAPAAFQAILWVAERGRAE